MKVDLVTRVKVRDLVTAMPSEYIRLHHSGEGTLIGISWKYGTADVGLHSVVKQFGGTWRTGEGWCFSGDERLQAFLAKLKKRNPQWPVLNDPRVKPLICTQFERLNGASVLHAGLVVQFPLPFHFGVPIHIEMQIYKLSSGENSIILFAGTTAAIDGFENSLSTLGATPIKAIVAKWGLTANPSPVRVSSTGWSVQVECDLSQLHHVCMTPVQAYKWDAPYPNGTKKVPIPWDGRIKTTRNGWTQCKSAIEALGLTWVGDDPDDAIATPTLIQTDTIQGWNYPAPNGFLLHEYQKQGVRFCASRGMRALIGDEMGIGKTAQAISAAQAIGARQIFVICPKNARYVWEREVKGWCGAAENIQHILDQTTALYPSARWQIMTYEQLVTKRESWTFINADEEQEVLQIYPEFKTEIRENLIKKTRKIAIDEFKSVEPALEPARLARWRKMMLRVRGALLAQIVSNGPITLIVDEAHRAKNTKSKRSQAIAKIADQHPETNVLLLTGTPLRNNEHEAAVLLGYLDPEARNVLSKKNGYTAQDVKDYLSYFMIRRTKAEVLPELPEKTRQRIDVDVLEPDDMQVYEEALEFAVNAYVRAISAGRSEGDARNQMRGGIERARTALGRAKVNGGQVADLVADVVEDKGCCVVFCAHHDVSDSLKVQLEAMGVKATVVDGRTSAMARSKTEAAFQNGDIEVFIGGINAAGEAITLTRADTVIFVELDWVPAALLQAEDRIHRVGQKGNCLVLHLIAKFADDEAWATLQNLDESLIDIIGTKMDRIGSVLDEDQSNLVDNNVESAVINQLLGKSVARKRKMQKLPDEPTVQTVVVEEGSEPLPLGRAGGLLPEFMELERDQRSI